MADSRCRMSPFGSYKVSLTFDGQTVEQALEVSGARTEFKLSR